MEWLVYLAAAAAAAAIGWLLAKRKAKRDGPSSEYPPNGTGENGPGGDLSGGEEGEYRNKRSGDLRLRKNELIRRLVDSIRFVETERVSDVPIPGSEPRESMYPVRDISMRPMRGIQEWRRMSPTAQLLPDEQFYAGLAVNSHLVKEYRQYVGKAANALIAVVDASGSMEEFGRVEWAISLVDQLIGRCVKIGAEMILIVYTDTIREVSEVTDQQSADKLRGRLARALHPLGGTDINHALAEAFRIAEEKGFGESKILLVTDGTAGVNGKMVSGRLKELNCTLHTVCIGGDLEDLRKLSSQYDSLEMNED
ncbi:MAG: VWA domain-containing protein [Candidatus Moranbacteria bacterium]|nr:VWA domain-containing protein [Candidatus Moranbacteria bacterium]